MDNVAKQNDVFKAGAKFALDEAAKWLDKEIRNYVTFDGEVEKEELIADFKEECSEILRL